jgi:hypothetical protein
MRSISRFGRVYLDFLGPRLFRCEHLNYEGWISLDFLGFSRPNRDLSIGYAAFPTSLFLPAFVVVKEPSERLAHDLAWRRDGLLMGQA